MSLFCINSSQADRKQFKEFIRLIFLGEILFIALTYEPELRTVGTQTRSKYNQVIFCGKSERTNDKIMKIRRPEPEE